MENFDLMQTLKWKELAEEIAKLKEDAAFNELKLAEQILALETKTW